MDIKKKTAHIFNIPRNDLFGGMLAEEQLQQAKEKLRILMNISAAIGGRLKTKWVTTGACLYSRGRSLNIYMATRKICRRLPKRCDEEPGICIEGVEQLPNLPTLQRIIKCYASTPNSALIYIYIKDLSKIASTKLSKIAEAMARKKKHYRAIEKCIEQHPELAEEIEEALAGKGEHTEITDCMLEEPVACPEKIYLSIHTANNRGSIIIYLPQG
jgi:hypothetical protein